MCYFDSDDHADQKRYLTAQSDEADLRTHRQRNAPETPPDPRDEAVRVLREALRLLHDNTADYIKRNNLGDPWGNQDMQQARAALAATEPKPEPAKPSNGESYVPPHLRFKDGHLPTP